MCLGCDEGCWIRLIVRNLALGFLGFIEAIVVALVSFDSDVDLRIEPHRHIVLIVAHELSFLVLGQSQLIVSCPVAPLNGFQHFNLGKPGNGTCFQASIDLTMSTALPLQIEFLFRRSLTSTVTLRLTHASGLLLEQLLLLKSFHFSQSLFEVLA